MDYISKALRSTKNTIQNPIYFGLASATNVLEARTTERLLRDERHASAPGECPEGNVRLHELCKACTLFTQRSVDLSRVDGSNYDSAWLPVERYRLCTVGHLRRLNGRCHLCTALYYLVSRSTSSGPVGSVDRNWLYLSVWQYRTSEENGSANLQIYIRPCASGFLATSYVGALDLCLLEDEGAGNRVDALARTACVPLRSSDNTECVREWLESCLRDHTRCRAADHEAIAPRTRPERMLAIDGDRVRLICNWSESSDCKYLALSHMWGIDPKQQLRLVLSRLDKFQEEIPWTDLSFIFKQAITIARQVGYNYIWIDSLCIVQDSPRDWANEAGKMADVYGLADCTIAYLFPPQDVLTKQRQDPKIWAPCVLRRPTSALRGVYIRSYQTRDKDGKIDIDRAYDRGKEDWSMDWLLPSDWPLFTRAWACQEYLLSPRILFVGHQNLMWECSELLCDELLGPITSSRRATASKTHFFAVKSSTPPATTVAAQLGFVNNWERIVCHYRAGLLTKPKDRIMAFAGIAQAVHTSSGMTYLAGSWAQMFPFSFTWSGCIASDESTEVEAVVDAVPSWSWFSVPIFTPDTFEFNVTEHILGMLDPSPMYQATLLSSENGSRQASAHPSPTRTFHDFTGMTLNIAMKTWTSLLRDSGHPDVRHERSIKDQFETLMGKHYGGLQCRFDHQDTARNHSDRTMTFGLLIENRTRRNPTYKDSLEEPILVGLLMQPEPSREAYKRIGLWTLYLKRYPGEWDPDTLHLVPIFDQLRGVRSEHIRLV